MLADDLGAPCDIPERVTRVVSLVPSLTEAIAVSAPGLLVGATEWCTHPGDLDVPRYGGTKNPDVTAIIALAPDLVVMNEEENRVPDILALRDAGLPVWVTRVRTLDEAFTSLRRLLTRACALDEPAWLGVAEAAWGAGGPGVTRSAVIPIWRRPWMFVGSDTFAGDVLARLGVHNALHGHAERYPKIALADLPPVELVVLPDEPYLFTADDGPECFPDTATALVSGRHLTWYGPSLVQAHAALLEQLG